MNSGAVSPAAIGSSILSVFQPSRSLPPGRSYQLLRVRIADTEGLVPEITGHRLQVSVRLMRADTEGRLRPAAVDMPFELTLCA